MNPGSSQSTIALEYLAKERHHFNEHRRTVYLVVGFLGLLLLGYDFYAQLRDREAGHLVNLFNDALFASFTLVFMYLGYRRSVKLERLERVVFVFLAFQSLVFNSLAPYLFNFAPNDVFVQTLGDDVWLLLLVCALALHLFDAWRGVVIAALFYTLSVAITGTYLIGQVGWSNDLFRLTLQLYLGGAMLLWSPQG
jgi:hypothetical protein